MLIISNHLFDKTDLSFPEHVVARVNVAWVNTLPELHDILTRLKHDVYLDYPQGRTKPPTPVISLEDTITTAHQFPHIKHFAVSNVEDPEDIFRIKEQLPFSIGIVPKIETELGINNLEKIVERIQNQYIMFDKEDLYLDVDRDTEKFQSLIDLARQKSKELGIEILELHGVIFLPYQH